MNFIEKTVYNFVKNNPGLKNKLRDVYQGLYDFLPQKANYSKSKLFIKEGYFLGFHDIQPFSEDASLILGNTADIDFQMPKFNDRLSVGYFNFSEEDGFQSYNEIGSTFSWNYHKGCRLQWCGEKNSKIIYNYYDVDKKELSSIIHNVDLKEDILINWPIDTVNPQGKVASSFSYERLEKCMPGYGYFFSDYDSCLSEGISSKTGLFLIDLEKNERTLLYSLENLAQSFSSSEFDVLESYHFVTHSQFSHDGRYLSFFHRIIFDENKLSHTRLLVHDFKTNELIDVPTKGMVSHYKWNENHEIVAYCRLENYDCHALISMSNVNNIVPIAYPALHSDGHQSFIKNSLFVTDTYANKFRMSKIYQVDIDSNKEELLVEVYSPKKFQTIDINKHIACDLHPRVSANGDFLCFDTVTTGQRSLAVMKL